MDTHCFCTVLIHSLFLHCSASVWKTFKNWTYLDCGYKPHKGNSDSARLLMNTEKPSWGQQKYCLEERGSHVAVFLGSIWEKRATASNQYRLLGLCSCSFFLSLPMSFDFICITSSWWNESWVFKTLALQHWSNCVNQNTVIKMHIDRQM